jgi:hypothetical protein
MQLAKMIILLTGYAGSGKTTAGEILMKLLDNYGPKSAAFGDCVKEESALLYDFPLDLAYSQEGKRTVVNTVKGQKTVRQILIDYSLEMKQIHGNDIWAIKMIDKMFQFPEHYIWIIHDWRFIEELETIKRSFYIKIITIRILRHDIVALDTPSEHQLDDCETDHTVINDGTLEDLKEKLKTIIRPYYSV